MEKDRVRVSALLDLYGEALSARLREVLRLRYDDDLSLSEIAENTGITRQGVLSALLRGEKRLSSFEEKLGFLAKTKRIDGIAKCIETEARRSGNSVLCGLSAELRREI